MLVGSHFSFLMLILISVFVFLLYNFVYFFKFCFCCTVRSCSGQNMPTTLALALTNRVAPEFFTEFKYFLSFRIFEQVALALKTEFALKFFKPGGRPPPPNPPPRTPMTSGISDPA